MSTLKELKQQGVQQTQPSSPFTVEEAQYMLGLIAKSEFKGHDVQVVYTLAYKLQEIIKDLNYKING